VSKIKIFSMGSTAGETAENVFTELEMAVNAWLKESGGVKITSLQTACCTGTNRNNEVFVNCTVVLLYGE